ncbi:M23 family metallopeptidase [Helicobacter saguini]|uniref:M23 family metallopeptidase n=1 Tax=Helicobacter saguini TaxID=1548018 RepID=UPI0026A6F152
MPNNLSNMLQVNVLLKDSKTPVSDIKITLESINDNSYSQTNISDNKGQIIFNNPIKSKEFKLNIKDFRFYDNNINTKRVANNYTKDNYTFDFMITPKIWFYYNGKEIYKCYGCKYIKSYVTLDNNKNIPQGEYYINIQSYNNNNLAIYTNKECSNILESNKGNQVYIQCNNKEISNDGIYIHNEIFSNDIMLLKHNIDKTNNLEQYKQSNSDIYNINFIVDYESPKVESIELTRQLDETEYNKENKVFLTAIFNNNIESKSQNIYNASKIETLWAYKEIPNTKDFNRQEILLDDINIIPKNRIISNRNINNKIINNIDDNIINHKTTNDKITNNTNTNNNNIESNQSQININNIESNLQYKGESLELDLVTNNLYNYDKQIVVFAYTKSQITLNDKQQKVLRNPIFRVITWFNPIVNPRVTIYNYSGVKKLQSAMFGQVRINQKQEPQIHQGIDLFAKKETPVYAPLDSRVHLIKVFDAKKGNRNKSYGNQIILELTGDAIKILKIRKKFISYKLKYTNKEHIKGKGFNENSNTYYLLYAHLSKILVKQGQEVKAGELIGYSGISGSANGTKAPHLHFEIRNLPNLGKGMNNRINPAFYLQAKVIESDFTKEEKQEQERCSKDMDNCLFDKKE